MGYISLAARGLVGAVGGAVGAGMDALGSSTVQGGNGVSGDTIDKIMNGIAYVETRGAPDAYTKFGKVVTKGMYAGDRAVGKYQVMGKNIPSWTKEAFGTAMTVEQFRNDPGAQDRLARHRMQKIYQQYGTPEDVASVWFTGRPYSQAGGSPADDNGTNNDTYIQVFRQGMNGGALATSRPATALGRPGGGYIPVAQRGM